MAARQCISLLKSTSSRLLQLQTGSAARQQIYFRNKHNLANLSTSTSLDKALVKDPKLVTLEEAAKSAEELAHDAALKGLLTVSNMLPFSCIIFLTIPTSSIIPVNILIQD